MAKRPDLVDITSITNSSTINAINQNWDRIQEAFDNTVSLDGSTPNAMSGDLDINGNALLNVGTIDTENLTLNGQQVTDLASVPEWRSAWTTATSYTKNDLVKINGNVYICLVSHTSGTFSTDLTALRWELMVPKGDSGAGTGDLLSNNNLSDLANPATARANLGLGTAAVENTVPVAKGGTGATDSAGARSNLGAQAAGATLDSLEGLSLVNGDLIRATGPDALTRIAVGGSQQVLGVSGGVPAWVPRQKEHRATQTTTSGTEIDFTGIPAGINEIDLHLEYISTTTNSAIAIRLGTSGGFITSSSYAGLQYNFAASLTPSRVDHTTSFVLGGTGGAPNFYGGTVQLRRIVGNIWSLNSTGWRTSDLALQIAWGRLDMGGELTQIRLLTGSGTFDNGSAYLRW